MQLRSTSKGSSKVTFAAPPGTACSTPRQAVNVESSVVKNKRQAERRAREIAEFIQREDWEALSKLDWKPRPHAGTFSIFVRVEFLPKEPQPGRPQEHLQGRRNLGFCKTNPAAAVTMKKEEIRPKDVRPLPL